jgi:ribosome-binding factor A
MAFRIERIERIIEKELATILLYDAHNPLLKYVSITKVSVTKDLSLATIWYTIMGTSAEIEATKASLEKSKGYLRSEVAKALSTFKTPDLKFKQDDSLENGNRIEEILKRAKEKMEQK